MKLIFILVLAVIVLIAVSIAQVYRYIPLVEVKRRARQGDKLSKRLYKVAMFEFSSQFILWLIASVASAGFFVLVTRRSPAWVALTCCLILIWIAYIWIPRSAINIVSTYLAQLFASPLAWVVQRAHPTVQFVKRKISRPKANHTGLYENKDLVDLLVRQEKQADNRIEKIEIDIIKHVMSFNKSKVIDVMTPRRKVMSIESNETLTPVILDELHNSGHRYFPVFQDKPANIVGLLSFEEVANTKSTPRVFSVMNSSPYYVNEEQYLSDLLQLITKANYNLFIVINDKADFSGIVTSKDILGKLVGDEVLSGLKKPDPDEELIVNDFADLQ